MTTALAAESTSIIAELKGSSYTLTAVKLHSTDPVQIADYIKEQISKAPGFFSGAPMVIDCSLLQDQSMLAEIADAIRKQGVIVVGVQGLDDDNLYLAEGIGLAVLRIPGGRMDSSQRVKQPPPHNAPLVVSQPVRSGQQIYAKGGDLIVLAAVNRDAEVIADGHIHVWGALRGKALAGASGNEDARIFARQLDAQLVSIAGNYRVLDDLADDLRGKDAQISLKENSIQIDAL